MAPTLKKLSVVKDPEAPVAVEVIEQAIVDIAEGMRRINNTRLTRRALVYLIHMHSKVGIGTIELVLNNLDSLEQNFLKRR